MATTTPPGSGQAGGGSGGRPVTFGWAPRFLHSTGQFHKGGPQVGVFLQITGAVSRDVDVPGRPYTFGRLQLAQALGDLRALTERGRPVVRLHLTDRAAGIRQLLSGRRGDRMTASYPPLRDLPPEEPPLAGHPAAQPAARPARPPAAPGAGPCALVVFGVTGDLARKKLIPAVYDLANRGLLPPGFAMVGFARATGATATSPSWPARRAQDGSRTGFRDDVWARLSDSIRFVPGSFDDDNAFDTLAETLISMEETHGIQGNAAFYLSIPPAMFPVVLKQMQRTRMADNSQRGGWRRVVVEKPFGHDLQSGKDLNRLVDEVFTARTSSGSTTTWARRPSRTCWRCGSPTRCSSRCGTATSSTRCRSRWPRTSASAAGPASTTLLVPPATCCRTTCCSCWR
jgi:hypothetical protein